VRDDPLFHHLHEVLPPAGRSSRAAFLVLLSSCGVTPAMQMRYAMAEQLRRAGYGEEAVRQMTTLRLTLEELARGHGSRAHAQRLLDAARGEPWWDIEYLPDRLPDDFADARVWREEMEFEPEPLFAEVRVPTLLLYGEDDDWIPIDESIAAWRRALGDEVEIVRVPGTGHDPVLVSGEVLPRYTETLVTWLRARS
jgi:pimeloyl-ACP methyl ester carboxylesterase